MLAVRIRFPDIDVLLALPRVLALASMLCAAGAGAQVNATLTVVFDYRFRGVSLSQQKPAVQANFGHDDPTGWYGGVFGSTVEFASVSRSF